MGKPGQTQVSGSTRKSALNAVKSRPEKSQKNRVSSQKKKNSDDGSSSPQTCCSNCQTVFEVSLELLSTSDTRVRCGECLSIFDALANLRELSQDDDPVVQRPTDAEAVKLQAAAAVQSGRPLADQRHNDTTSLPNPNAAALAGLASDTSSLDVTYSDFDLFSADAALPEIHFFDSTRHTPDFHFDDVVDLNDETFSDTLFAQDVTVDAQSVLRGQAESRNASGIALGGDVGFVTDEDDSEPLIFKYQDAEPAKGPQRSKKITKVEQLAEPIDKPPAFDESIELATVNNVKESLRVPEPGSSSWLLRLGLFFIAAIIAGGLYAYRDRDALLNNSVLRPWLISACDYLSCQLPDQIDLDALRAVDRSVVMHPTVSNALIIKFGIVNQADFSQPYPVLEIRLEDRAGRLVVINQFLPSEYSRGWQQGDVLDPGKRLDIGLAVEDPGSTAISFQLDFYEVK